MPRCGEEVGLLGEGGLHHLGRAGDDRAARVSIVFVDEGRHVRDEREEDVVERLLRRCAGGRAGCGCAPARPSTGSTDRPSRTCRPRATSPRWSSSENTTFCFVDAERLEVGRARTGPSSRGSARAGCRRGLRGASPHASRASAGTGASISTRRMRREMPFSTTTSLIGAPSLRHRRRLVEVLERELRLVVDEVRELLRDLLALLDEREHRLLALDGALLAGEARDVAARSCRRASWCR